MCHNLLMKKEALIKARVSDHLKRLIEAAAVERGESEAVIIREALNDYLDRLRPRPEDNSIYRKPPGKKKVA